MRKPFVIAAVAVGLVATGCNEDKCPTEPPKLAEVANCTVRPGARVSYEVRLCPTCNQTGATCDVDMSAAIDGNGQPGDIFLDPKVEACDSGNSCPGGAACEFAPLACTFTAPMAEGTYTVTVFDAGSVTPQTRTLTVSLSASPGCDLVPI